MKAETRAAVILYLASLSGALGFVSVEGGARQRGKSLRRSQVRQSVTSLNAFEFKNPFAPKRSEEKESAPASFDVGTLKASTEPRPFRVAPSLALDVASASFPFLLRAGSGALANGYRLSIAERNDSEYSVLSLGKYQLKEDCDRIPPNYDGGRQPVILYEFEACPYCRKVREAVSILSLEVKYLPCPKRSVRFRSGVKEKYGQSTTFPLMIDPNTGVRLFESDEIVPYLFKNYGPYKSVPKLLSRGAFTTATCALGLLPRFGRGGQARSSKPTPREALVLWAYESSPFCKLVREELCELQLPHIQISCPRGSPNRQRLFEKTGRFQVPYLEDVNSGAALFETEAILEYLRSQYGVEPSPVKYI